MKSGQIRNPFRPSKFEVDNHSLLWVSPISNRLMREPLSAFISGARGCGKTSILKCLDSIEQLSNPSLRSQIFKTKVRSIGVYCRMPDLFTQTTAGADWSRVLPNSPDHEITATYFLSALLEGAASEQLLRTAYTWLINGYIDIRLTAVDRAVQRLAALYPNLSDLDPVANPLMAAADRLKEHREGLLQAFSDGDRERFRGAYRLSEPFEFIASVAQHILPLFKGKQLVRSEDLRLKVLLDECDYLLPEQQRVLNTLVRKSKRPIDWIMAFVPGGIDTTSTIYPTLTNSVAERVVIDLDNESDVEFGTFCQQVTSFRLFYSLTHEQRRKINWDGVSSAFPLHKRLGRFSVNELLHFSFQQSQSSELAAFQMRAEELTKTLMGHQKARTLESDTIKALDVSERIPAYYQQFLIEKIGLDIEGSLTSDKRRRALLATLRRKQRGAFLQILHVYGKTVIPYAGERIVLGLADNCIRDFLDIMAAIFDMADATSSEGRFLGFCSSNLPISIATQARGVRAAAEEKFQGFQQRVGIAAKSLTRAVDGLGLLTRDLQVDPDDLRSVKTEERGIFDMIFDERDQSIAGIASHDDAVRVLDLARRENLLIFDAGLQSGTEAVTVVEDQGRIRFRLHRRFAPRYGFSYRGALAPVRLRENDFRQLITHSNTLSPRSWADTVRTRTNPDDMDYFGQSDLFEGGTND